MSDWLEKFDDIVGTSRDVIEGVHDVLDDVIRKADPKPTKVPQQTQQPEDEQRRVSQEMPNPNTAASAPAWLLSVAALVVIVLLLR